MSKKAMIIGAGIGGLCSAIALQKQGFQVKVFDKAKDFSTVGAGIVLAANALKVLEQLDLTGEVMSQGARVGKAEIRTWDGKLIVNLPTNEQAKRYGTHSYLIHRVYLQSILLNHIDLNTDIHLNKKLLTFKQTKSKVTAYFADGTEEEGDILIGADGIHSNVRKQLVGPEKLRYAGYTAFRGICDFKHDLFLLEDGGGFEAWGPGKRFGFSQLGKGKVFWFAAINSPQGMNIPIGERKDLVQKLFHDWYNPVGLVLEATEETSILHHDIFDRPPLKNWSKGLVTLLGDAAHPMLPNLGQGGAQAMEDALVLAHSLNNNKNTSAALLDYEKVRIARTTSIVNQSRRMARMVQLENPVMIKARNISLRSIPSKITVKQLDWVVGHEV